MARAPDRKGVETWWKDGMELTEVELVARESLLVDHVGVHEDEASVGGESRGACWGPGR